MLKPYRQLSIEKFEHRLLLAADLAVHVDGYELGEPGEQVTRTIRVFNNGDEAAKDAVIRSDLTEQLDDVS